MKKDWEIKKLGDVCLKRDSIKWKNENSNTEYQYIDLSAVDRESKGITDTQIITKENAPSRAQQLVKTGDILFGTTRPTLKRFCLLSDDYDGQICSTGFCVVRPNQRIVSPDWIFYQFYNEEFYKYIEPLQKGANYPAVTDKDIYNFNIPVPPLEEQKRIVKILDEKFAQLETIKAASQTNLQNAKDLFQSQLAKAFCNTTWEKKRLETITKIKSGFAFKGSAFKTTGEYQVLRLGNVKQNYLRIDEKAVFVSGISSSDLLKAKVNIGDLVVTQTGTKGKRDYGFVAIVDRDNLLLNQRLAAITTAECLYNRYLLYYSYTENFKDQFFANEGGTVGQGNIGLTDIKEIEIPLPSLSEQKRIVKELDALSKKVRQLQEIYTKQIANCDELKQAYLQKAFEGEL